MTGTRSVVLLAWLSLLACSHSAPPYPPTPDSVPPAVQAPLESARPEAHELPQRCAEDTAQWFARNFSKPEESVSVPEGATSSTVAIEYENHYSAAKHGCFAVLSQLTSVRHSHAKSKDTIVLMHTLWNVNESARVGAYVVQNVEAMTACEVAGAVCTSKGQWLEMVHPYLAE